MLDTPEAARTTARDPIARTAFRAASLAVLLVLLAALTGAGVRLLPWALDPTIPWGTLAPFAKSLFAVAIEAAILTGWPVGWALAASRLVERGEARVLASLGESPAQTLARLAPQIALFCTLLACTSVAMGREAIAPGRVVEALLVEGRDACMMHDASDAQATHATHAVPFVGATWLCTDVAPRLVGRAPFGGIVYSASGAHVTSDLRRIDLDDARLALRSAPSRPNVEVHVRSLSLKGMTPWSRASSLPPLLRALVVTLSACLSACGAVALLLWRFYRRIGGVAAVAVGASGPLSALFTLRWLELRVPNEHPGAWLVAFALVPLSAVCAVALAVMLANLVRVKSSTSRHGGAR